MDEVGESDANPDGPASEQKPTSHTNKHSSSPIAPERMATCDSGEQCQSGQANNTEKDETKEDRTKLLADRRSDHTNVTFDAVQETARENDPDHISELPLPEFDIKKSSNRVWPSGFDTLHQKVIHS